MVSNFSDTHIFLKKGIELAQFSPLQYADTVTLVVDPTIVENKKYVAKVVPLEEDWIPKPHPSRARVF